MNRERALSKLREYEPELRAIGVISASLFGSVARDSAGKDSDIDVAVKLSEGFSSGGFDYFWQLEELKRRLSRVLDYKVDVVVEPARKESFRDEINRDRAFAF